jgi:hypothetical protein
MMQVGWLRLLLLFFSAVESPPAPKHQGVCWVAGREAVSDKELATLTRNHVTWISQTPFGWQRDASTPELALNTGFDKVWWGESDEGICITTQLARTDGIETILKPHLWVRKGWPGDICMNSEADWHVWFANYERFILHYAELAEQQRIPLLCIGTELHRTVAHEKEWRALISKIRSCYSGQLTYAANFHQEFEEVAFWDALDYIGIQAYFPLSKEANATVPELQRNWRSHLPAIARVHRLFGKPVLFTEIGYKSTVDTAREPWRWPEAADANQISEEAQARCYQAFFNEVWNQPWLAGAYFWKWYPHGRSRWAAADFTPQGKLAEDVMRAGFAKNGNREKQRAR